MAPEDNKTVVFNKGTSNAEIGVIPIGGQIDPTSMLGLKEEWKKAQKKPTKKKTSEQINNNIPKRKPLSTLAVCFP